MGKPDAAKVVGTYLERLHEIRATKRGTPELSYRGALENLLDHIGEDLDPEVCVMGELGDIGAGRPDFGFFEKKSQNTLGVVETKKFAEEVPHTADGAQVAKYWKQYRVVLVTNYRDFLLVATDGDQKPRVEGRYSLAGDEETFWRTPAGTLVESHADGLANFLIGAMKRSAPITRPRDLADDLARHAREAKRRLERHDITALGPLKEAMEKALGLHFEGRDGEDFFRSSLVQTLFYGLFSGWMLWRQDPKSKGAFDWKDVGDHLALPLIGNLYEEIARPTRLRDLDLREPLEWATASLNRIVTKEFFKSFDADHAITLFYEPFLEAFDPHLRKELGVWYTPPEIVKYMVGRVDQLLRSELGIADGLADDSVYVLDPAAGTGSYVVEVARRIHQTLSEQGHGALAATKTKKALTSRVFGFEILPAPYVVAHLQLGVLLKQMGTKLGKADRCGVYLTNALTGWDPPKGAKKTLGFQFLEDEQKSAARVKRETPILVVIGNPPYNGFAGVAQQEEADLMAPYYRGLEEYGVQVRGLNDLYIRFFRLAERRIGEVGGRGIVSFISNSSWLDGQSHPAMRRKLLGAFDKVWIDNCNGDKYRTGKRTPDGRSDQSMFTTDAESVGIQVGTAITTLVKSAKALSEPTGVVTHYRNLWGTANSKRTELLETLTARNVNDKYSVLTPRRELRFILVPASTGAAYPVWSSLPNIFQFASPGVQTARDELVVDIDREVLTARMGRYFDPAISNELMREECPCSLTETERFPAAATRQMLLRRGLLPKNVVPFSYRPLDNRWLYWEPDGKLLDEKRAEYFPQVFPGNVAITAAAAIRKGTAEGPLPIMHLGSRHLIERGTNIFPMLYRPSEGTLGGATEPNIRPKLLEAVCELIGSEAYQTDGHAYSQTALRLGETLFYHVLGVLWSPHYRTENDAALRQDWPRVPLPADAPMLEASAQLGRAVADLLLPDKDVLGVTKGTIRSELRDLAIPTKRGDAQIEEGPDTTVDAGWGFFGQKNAVMCGKGGVTLHKDHPDNAVDVWINDAVCWANIPKDVWAMTIGGYPVVKKWLSYREYKVLGRPLKTDELFYITQVVRRLKALLMLGPDLDANYKACAAGPQISFKNA